MNIENRIKGTYKRNGQGFLFNIGADNIDEVWNFLTNAYPGCTISQVDPSLKNGLPVPD
jgi:hypothetical protein